MAVAGYSSKVLLAGTSTAFTGEGMTQDGTTPELYAITDTTKEVWDPSTVPTFYDGGVPISAGSIVSIDYLFGTVLLTAAAAGALTVDGDYYPMLEVAEAKEFSISLTKEVLDSTVFDQSNNHKLKTLGLLDASGSLGSFDNLLTDIDPGGGTTTLWDTFLNGTAKVVEIQPGAATPKLRVWALLDTEELSASVDSLVEATINWMLAPQSDSAGRPASFGTSS